MITITSILVGKKFFEAVELVQQLYSKKKLKLKEENSIKMVYKSY